MPSRPRGADAVASLEKIIIINIYKYIYIYIYLTQEESIQHELAARITSGYRPIVYYPAPNIADAELLSPLVDARDMV